MNIKNKGIIKLLSLFLSILFVIVFGGCEIFDSLFQKELTVIIEGGGHVKVDGVEQTKSEMVYQVSSNKEVELQAINSIGNPSITDSSKYLTVIFPTSWVFKNMDVDGISKDSPVLSVIMSSDRTVKVRFVMYGVSMFKQYLENNELHGYTKIQYDSEGKEVKEDWYDANSTFTSSDSITYDSSGKIIKWEIYDSNTNLNSFETYEYDSENKLVKREVYDFNNNLIEYYIFKYNSVGKLQKREQYNSDDTLGRYEIYEYNSLGNLVKRKLYNSDDTLNSYYMYEYDSEKNRIAKVSFYNSDDSLNMYSIYKYDAIGKIIKEVHYNSDDIQSGYWEIEYEEIQ